MFARSEAYNVTNLKLRLLLLLDGDLYTGTVADFSGMDPIIYREPLQTEQYDSMSLNGKKLRKPSICSRFLIKGALINMPSLFITFCGIFLERARTHRWGLSEPRISSRRF